MNLLPQRRLFVIGERLNTHRETFRAKVAERKKRSVLRTALRQQRAGVTHLDIHTGASGKEKEIEDFLFVLDAIGPGLLDNVGVLIDTNSPECARVVLEKLQRRPGTILNAITGETRLLEGMLPLAVEHQTGLVAVLTAPGQNPRSMDERLTIAEKLHTAMNEAGIPDERQYFDPQVLPVAFDPVQPRAVLETVREIRRRWPLVHVIAGLSNVSFNMPERWLLNRTYLPMLLYAGVNGVILDPCDFHLQRTRLAAKALLGQDEFLAGYLAEARSER